MFYVASKVGWALAQPSNVLMLGLALGALLLIIGRRRTGTWLVASFAAGFLLIGTLPVGAWLLLPLENRFPADPPLPAELAGVVVLGGALSPVLSQARKQPVLDDAGERMTALLALERRLPDRTIAFTGGLGGPILTRGAGEADAVAAFLAEQGVDPARVVLEGRSRNTYENGLFTKQLLEPAPGSCWLLVTSAFHMPRAVGVFRQLGWNVLPYPVDFRTRGTMEAFAGLDVADRLVELDLAVHSWLGMLVYAVTGRSSEVFPAAAERPCAGF